MAQGPGTLLSPNAKSIYIFGSSASQNLVLGPNDGKQHYLTAVNIEVAVPIGTVSGACIAQAQLQDNGSPFNTYLITSVYFTTLPSTGNYPHAQASLTWPGGVAISIQASLTNQLNFLIDVAGEGGGSITSPRLEGTCSITWV